MRSTWLVLGMLIPAAVAFAFWEPSEASQPPRGAALASLYSEGGAKVVTADVDALLENGAAARTPEVPNAAASDAPPWLDALLGWLPTATPEPPMLLILVAGPHRLAQARAGVADDRIAAESPEAFVVGEDRMVAASRDAAADLLMRFDWIDRPLELFTIETRRKPIVAQRGTRNADVAALPMLNANVAADAAPLRGSDQARIGRAMSVVPSAID